jgi:hypothetical protein
MFLSVTILGAGLSSERGTVAKMSCNQPKFHSVQESFTLNTKDKKCQKGLELSNQISKAQVNFK